MVGNEIVCRAILRGDRTYGNSKPDCAGGIKRCNRCRNQKLFRQNEQESAIIKYYSYMCGAVQYGQPLAVSGVPVQEGAFRRRPYTRNEDVHTQEMKVTGQTTLYIV